MNSDNLECSIIPAILNLHYFKRKPYIFVICQALFNRRKTKKRMRDTTWRQLGVKIREPAFWGNLK